METTFDRWRRRLFHVAAHPILWSRLVWGHEVRHREGPFRLNPRFVDYRPMYRTSRLPLARFLDVPVATLDRHFGELAQIRDDLRVEVGDTMNAGALLQAPLLYLIVRSERPYWVVETGVSTGYSARFILEAMARNNAGHLDSVGIDRFAAGVHSSDLPAGLRGRSVGWLVPDRLRSRWSLHIGTSEETLPAVLAQHAGTLDGFLHDSLHQYPVMRREYELGSAAMRPGGLLMSHDIHTSRAWPEFLGTRSFSGDVELDHDLGVVRLPAANGTSPRPTSG
ncbi:MAG TPA: class I SAM-dependent methyltransferase [Thermoplasmata archaeon]|nr:class I SAM-dependent methyltransferase [Thermoplasmata archaeon]